MNAAPEALLAAFVGAQSGLAPAAVETAAGGSAAVGPVLAELRRRGHEFETAAAGLRLVCASQHFDPAAFRAARRGRLGAVLEVWERAASSNDLARAGAAGGAPDGTVWLVEEQTQGRGRQGRAWQCPPHAGLLFSFFLRHPLAPEARPTLLPLAVALGACEALRQVTGLPVGTKWPNDLGIGGRKVAGILVEARAGAGAAVGVGLNVARAARTPDLPFATALAAEPGTHVAGREALLAAVLAGIERRVADWCAGEFEALCAAWSGTDTVLGRDIAVDTGEGRITGRAVAITGLGLLQLELPGGGRRELAAGEVHLR